MSEFVIFSVPGSPFGRMPLLVCEEKGAPYQFAAMGMGDNQSPEYLARNPFGKIPALEHGDFRLYETRAMITYIDQVAGGPSLTPTDPKAVARMNQVMNIADWYVAPTISNAIGWNRVVAPMFGMPSDLDAVAEAMPLARTTIKALEDILGDNPYFAGDQISLADIMAFAHIEFMPMSPEGRELLEGSPLNAWLDRMNARPSAHATSWDELNRRAAA